MRAAVANQNETGIVGHLPPLVKIESDGIGELQSGQTRCDLGREHGQRSIGPIHMEPQAFPLGDIGYRAQRIDRAGIDGAGSGGDEERRKALRAILRNGLFQSGDIHLMIRVDRDRAQRVRTDPGHIHHLGDGTVRPGGGICGQALAARGDALRAHLGPEFSAAGDQYRDQRGHRSAGHEQAAGGVWKAEQFAYPAQHLPFDFDGHLVASTKVRIQAGSQHLCQHPHRRAAAMHPAHKARVGIACRIRQDGLHESLVGCSNIRRLLRQRLAELLTHAVGYRLPDRA